MTVAPAGNVTERVIAELKEGRTVPAIAARVGVSEIFVNVMLDHYGRLGVVSPAESLCASGQGACGPSGATTEAAQVACAGCFFAK